MRVLRLLVLLPVLVVAVPVGAQSDTDAKLQQLQDLDSQARAACSSAQVDALQPQLVECMGGQAVCLTYKSPTCTAKEKGETGDGSVEPFACLTECTAVKMGPCAHLYTDLIASCNGGTSPSTTPAPATPEPTTTEPVPPEPTTPEPIPPSSKECPGDHRVKVGDFCECELGYQVDADVGGCMFITSGANLDPSSTEKLNDAVVGLVEKPNGIDVIDVVVGGKTVRIGLARDPLAIGVNRYTTDGVHFYTKLNDALQTGFGSHLGQRIVNGIRGGLSALSLFNWFNSGYAGDDKDGKFAVGRQVANDDIDHFRHRLLGTLKYRADFLNGLAAYIDLRSGGTAASDIARGKQDIDAEIERLTSRMHISVSNRTAKLSDEDKARVDAAYKRDLFEAFEDGYQRYALRQLLNKAT